MRILKQNLIIIVLAVTLLNPTMVFAQNTNTSGIGVVNNYPTYKGVEKSLSEYLCTPDANDDGHALERCVNKIYRFGISFGAIALVFFIVFAGYLYITGGEKAKGRGKEIFLNSLVGMGILLLSYVILRFVNPNLVVYRTIQPPIFSSAPLPSCESIGFSHNCILSTGNISYGGDECDYPIKDQSVNGLFNNTLHSETGSGHGPVRNAPNGAPPLGTVDVGVKGGSAVYSAISGKVVKYGDLGAFGKFVSIISNTNGGEFDCETSNACVNEAHIEPTVKVGDLVRAGQQIGTMTNYSGGLGPHLHIELKLGGQWVTGDGKKGTWDNMKTAISKCIASK